VKYNKEERKRKENCCFSSWISSK